MQFKTISLNGISYLEKMDGTSQWYWGSDYCHGDLYEAEELFNTGHKVQGNRLVFVKYPEGEVFEPVKNKDGQYFGTPVYDNGFLYFLQVDFTSGLILINSFDEKAKKINIVASLDRKSVKSCYNLLLRVSPVFLCSDKNNGNFEILWPEQGAFSIEETETVYRRVDDTLISSCWFEDPDYREENIFRKYPTGEVIKRLAGTILELPDGQKWLLK